MLCKGKFGKMRQMKRLQRELFEMADPLNKFRFPSTVKIINQFVKAFGNIWDSLAEDYTNNKGYVTPAWSTDVAELLEASFDRKNILFTYKKTAPSKFDKFYDYIGFGEYFGRSREIQLYIKKSDEQLKKYFKKLGKKKFSDPKENKFLAELIYSYSHEYIHRQQEAQNVENIQVGKNKKDPYDKIKEIQAGAFETAVSKKMTGKHSPAILIFTKRGKEVKDKFLDLVRKIK